MVHFCKLCQLLHKNMDFIQCDESNVWLLEAVFAVKITPLDGRVEPICRKCIRKYNKVMKDLKKSNGGFPVSRQTLAEHTKVANGDVESLAINSGEQQQLQQAALQSPLLPSLALNQGSRSSESHPYLMDDESKELMFTGASDPVNGSQNGSNGFALNISGDAATVYRTSLGDTQESSEDDSSDGKSSVPDEDDEEDDSTEESSEDDDDDDDECCSDDTDDTSSSCTSSSSSGGSSSETGASLRLEEHIEPNAQESTVLYSSYLQAPLMQNLPEGSLLQCNGDGLVVEDQMPPDKTGDELEPLQLEEPLAKIENDVDKNGAKPEEAVSEENSKKSRKRKKRPSGTAVQTKNYICNVCQKRFSKAIYLKVHYRTHTGEKPYACDICFKSFTQASSLNTHKRLHFNVKPFVCEICNQQYTSAGNYKVHLRTHTQEKPYACSYCDKRFSQHSSKKMHERVHSQEKPYPCQVCLKAFSNVSNLTVHMRIHQGLKPYKCDKCDKSFAQSQTLKTHYISAHTDVRPFQCDLCPKSYATLSNLNNHKHTHMEEKPFGCEECGKRFTQKSSLKTHILSHSTERPFPCTECTKSFNSQAMLNTHRRNMHCTVRPFGCTQCTKSYAQETRLRQHMLSHAEIKPHPCVECGKTFATATNLRIHQRVHSGEKPYACPTCGKCFSQRSSLRTHEILHLPSDMGPDSVAASEGAVPGGGKKKRKSKNLECDQCGKQFTVRGRYYNHMKQVHQKDVQGEDGQDSRNLNHHKDDNETNNQCVKRDEAMGENENDLDRKHTISKETIDGILIASNSAVSYDIGMPEEGVCRCRNSSTMDS
ncbi:AGAP004651-PA-like protein [Anopheles sinensis]|uniref:Zinc finger protein 865 n=1 Tax=Anopheles sinensis TaxID=74873 RepID=A0A084W806_ANOSI|nr:AGAP004651-PA-like protein [Anopheles sinensis]